MIIHNSKFKALFILIVISIFILACSESTDPEDEELIGTWELTKIKVVYADDYDELDPEDQDLSMTLTIKGDHTYTLVRIEEGETSTVNGTWSKSGNKLRMKEGGYTEEHEYSLDGDKLAISYEWGEFTIIEEFTRQ